MTGTLQFLLRYGYLLLFGWVFCEQMGLPIPSMPLLLVAGALVGTHKMNFEIAIALPIFAAVTADVMWYELGRRKGIRVLQFLCKISLEPDSCVRQTESVFEKHGASSLLVSKFVPGFGAAAAPLAGVFRMKFARFFWLDLAGSVIWAGTFFGLGYIFSDAIERIAGDAKQLGAYALVLLAAALAGYLAWKFMRRQKFIRQLRIDRITPEELKKKLDKGEDVVIVDLRGSMDFEAEPDIIPGARRMKASEVEAAKDELAKAREVVLYCT
ncbi:MAG: VTT domain-containing protein [Candidatus Acidiferrales bacterium]